MLGTTDDLPEILQARASPTRCIIAIPSAGRRKRAAVVATCREAASRSRRCRTSTTSSTAITISSRQLRAVQVEDMLGREPVQLDPAAVGAYVPRPRRARDRRRRLDRLGALPPARRAWSPRRLVLVDHAENNLFTIERELRERGVTSIVAEIADVATRPAWRRSLETAAAGGRVPRGGLQARAADGAATPCEALRNNALGTRIVARLAATHGRRALRARLDRQGRQPDDRRWAPARRSPSGSSRRMAQVEAETALRGGALRQRARLVRLASSRSSASRSRAAARSRSRTPR